MVADARSCGQFLCVLACYVEVGVIVRGGDGISLLDKLKILVYNRDGKRTGKNNRCLSD